MCMCVYVYDLRWIINNKYNYIFIIYEYNYFAYDTCLCRYRLPELETER